MSRLPTSALNPGHSRFNVGRSMFNVLLIFLSISISGFSPLQAQETTPATLLEGDSGISLQPSATGEKILHWLGRADRTYFIQASPDLLDWTWAPNIESGIDGPMSYEVDGPVAAGFFRLQYTDQTAEDVDSADFDGDGLSNNFELTPRPRPGGIVGYANLNPNIQTSPLLADTDHDGLSDKWELEHGFDPTDNGTRNPNNGPDGDTDGDGITNLQEYIGGTNPKSNSDYPLHMITAERWGFAKGFPAPAENSWGFYRTNGWEPGVYFQSDEDHFSLNLIVGKLTAIPYPQTPGAEAEGFQRSFAMQTAVFSGSASNFDGSIIDATVREKGVWLKASPKPELREYQFLKITEKKNLTETLQPPVITADLVSLQIQPNQTHSEPYELAALPEVAVNSQRSAYCSLSRLRLVSRDRYLAGSINVSGMGSGVSAEFINTTTGEDLGTYAELENSDGATRIFSDVTKVLDPTLSPGDRQPVGKKVWFVKDNNGDLNFYTCFKEIGEIEIRLKTGGTPLLTLHHTLTSAQDFSEVIDYVNDWVNGTALTTGGTTPVVLGAPPPGGGGSGGAPQPITEINYLTSACLIPLFNVVGQVEGLTGVFIGFYDGLKAGLIDDRDFILLVGNGVVSAGSYAAQHAQIEIENYFNNPIKRAQEIKNLTDQLINDILFKTCKTIDRSLSTWEGFKDKSWAVWDAVGQAATLQFTITKTLWPKVVDGLCDWGQDFGNRMMIGSEQTHWGQKIWVVNKLLASVDDIAGTTARTAAYTIGYSSGYIVEQVCVAIGTDGVYTLAKIAAKGVVRLGSELSLKTAFAVASRGQLVKRWLAGATMSVEMEITAERGLVDAAKSPISAEFKDTAAEVWEQTMRRESYNRSLVGYRTLGEEVANAPRLQQLFLIEGTEARFWKVSGKLNKKLGDESSAEAMRGWVKVYDRCLKIEGGALLDDRAEDLFKLVKLDTTEGKKALRKSLEEFGATDGSGKFWLRDVEKIQAEGYRYSNFDPRFDEAGNAVSGPPKLNAADAPSYGWYASFGKFEKSNIAKSSLQIPPANSAKFRLEFDWEAVKNNVRISRGSLDTQDWFEMLAKDFPLNGSGVGSQVLVDGTNIPIKAIWDISGEIPIKIY